MPGAFMRPSFLNDPRFPWCSNLRPDSMKFISPLLFGYCNS
jgi:hypothetical protein